ncbi:methyltransferase [Candidatus Parvarchaeota archaeon]|nr:methyltransferase [Candidatus Parvarchaeota archaeon]
MHFSKLISRANKKYYCDPKTRIYYDFKTTSGACGKTARACAIIAAQLIKKKIPNQVNANHPPAVFRIAEFGVGEGDFAAHFLKNLKNIVGSPLFASIEYCLCDFSAPLLAKAKEKLSRLGFGHILQFCRVNLAYSKKFPYSRIGKFDYVVSNEMYDDLPAQMLCNDAEVLKEVIIGPDCKFRKFGPKAQRTPFAGKPWLPDGYFVAYNNGCIENLKIISKCLKENGRADIFDYGFSAYSQITSEPKDFWNFNVARKFGTQITTDVNFVVLSNAAKKHGFGSSLELQSEFLSKVYGKRHWCVELDDGLHYFSKKELRNKQNRKMLERQGYSHEFITGKFCEGEDYWHFGLKKK